MRGDDRSSSDEDASSVSSSQSDRSERDGAGQPSVDYDRSSHNHGLLHRNPAGGLSGYSGFSHEWEDSGRFVYQHNVNSEKDFYGNDARAFAPAETYGLDQTRGQSEKDYFAGISLPYSSDRRSKKLPKRDPMAPKQPARAYVLYMNNKREELKASDPSLSFAEVQAQVGSGWTALSDKARAKYEALAEKDKERYLNEMKMYEPVEGSGYGADGYLLPDKRLGRDFGISSRRDSKRDPIAPKPPATAFFFFASSRRDEIKLQEPGISFTDLQKRLGYEWQNLDAGTKSLWLQSVADAKERYLDEMKHYKPSDPTMYGPDGYYIKDKEDKEKRRKLLKTIRDPMAPKPPLTAFFLFMKAQRETIKARDPTLSFVDLQKKIGIEWSELDEKSRSKYIKKAAKERDRYLDAMQKYQPDEGSGFDATGHKIVKRKRGEEKKPRRDPSAPKLPLHAYGFFVRQRREELKNVNRPSHQIIAQIGAEWQSMDERTRKKFINKAEKDTERYANEMREYVPGENSGYGPDGHIIREKKTERKKRSQPKRDPNAPKPAMSAFLTFAKSRRLELRKTNPDLSFGEIQKMLGKEWGTLPERNKKEFQKTYEREKERYEKELEKYAPPEGSGYDSKGRFDVSAAADGGFGTKRLPKRDPRAPKPAARAYILYGMKRREELKTSMPGTPFAEMQKIIGGEWTNLPESEKNRYVEKAENDKSRYQREMELYEPVKGSGYDADGLLRVGDKPRKRMRRDPNAPKLPSRAYVIFMAIRRKAIREEQPELSFGEASKIIGDEWKELGAKNRAKYENRAARDRERFEMELKEYRPPEGYGPDGVLLDLKPKNADDIPPPPFLFRGAGERVHVDAPKHKRPAPSDSIHSHNPNAAFLYFASNRREESKSAGMPYPTVQQLSLEWQSLDEVSRGEYIRQASHDSDRFAEDVGQYRHQHVLVPDQSQGPHGSESANSLSFFGDMAIPMQYKRGVSSEYLLENTLSKKRIAGSDSRKRNKVAKKKKGRT